MTTEDRTPTGVRPDLAAVLSLHYVTKVECDPVAKTDTVRCNCSVWTGTPQPSIGKAIRQWVDHVSPHIDAAPAAEPVPLTLAARAMSDFLETEFLTFDPKDPADEGVWKLVSVEHRQKLDDLEDALLAALASPDKGEPRPKRKRIDWSDVVVDEGDEAP